jgi:hypothetical protein
MPNLMYSFLSLGRSKESINGEESLVPSPTAKLEDHPLSAVCNCLFSIFEATLHIWKPFPLSANEDAPCRGDRGPT